MITKTTEKQLAIQLRKEGKTYSEILAQIHVAKSTLSIWLGEVGLSKKQNQEITAKRIAGARRGADARKRDRIERASAIITKARSEISSISHHELFLIGVILYWTEGSKEKEYRPGSTLKFSNMDPRMIRVFLLWLKNVCKVPDNMIVCQVALHENHTDRVPEVKKHWEQVTGFGPENFRNVMFKKNKISGTKRKNTGENYFGLLQVSVLRSSQLVRQIAGWTEGVYGRVVS